MKKPFNTFIAICALIAAAAVGGCSDDLYLKNEIGSELTENSDFRISSFYVSRDLWTIPADVTSIDVILESKSDGTIYQLAATVEHGLEDYTVSVMIPKDKHLPDGDYLISGALTDGTRLGSYIEVTVRDEMVQKVLSVAFQYNLSGSGTQDDPYQIDSADAFKQFLTGLSNDSSHAAGVYFRQTADFATAAKSGVQSGQAYTGYDFAGIYDGQSHTITLNYTGMSSDADVNVGLFPALRDGATISNLTIKTAMSSVKSNAGAFAGICTGKVALTNVHVIGSTAGQENVGAFVGNSQGNLTVSNCTAHVMLAGVKNVGAVVGSATAGSLTVSTFTSRFDKGSNNFLSAEATTSHVGGVAGYVNNCAITFDHMTIQHTIDSQSSKVVVLKSPNYCGGLIGEAIINQASSITDCKIVTPLSCSLSYAGGLIGKLQLNADLKINTVTIGAYLNTHQYVGGFFGHAVVGNHLIIETKSGQNSNQLVKTDASYCGIVGSQYVGGLFGYFQGNVAPKGVFINMNVIGSSGCVGGVAGAIENSRINCGNISYGNTMQVKGPESVGGVVGYANASTIEGGVNANTKLTTSMSAGIYPSLCPIIVSCDVVNDRPVGGTAIGGLVGYGYRTTIKNVSFSGSVTGTNFVGGVVGRLVLSSTDSLVNCANNGLVVKNTWNTCTGGVAGLVEYTGATVKNLANFAEVSGMDYTGGIIGSFQIGNCGRQFTVSLALNSGTVKGTANVGGCFGYICGNSGDNICVFSHLGNTGAVSSTADGNVGGCIGYANKRYLRVLQCANHGSVSSSGNSKVGGIAGRLGINTGGLLGVADNMQLGYCCNRGEISSTHKGSNVGGILGYQEDGHFNDDYHFRTHDCYNAGAISSTAQKSDNGGVVGYVDNMGSVYCCYNYGQVAKGNGVVGTHKKNRDWYHEYLYFLEGTGKNWACKSFKYADRSNQSSYSGFDFRSDWAIDSKKNDGYPYLKDCPFQFR